MAPLLQLLIYRLTERGILLDHIPTLVRDVLRIISEGGVFTTRLVNARLEQLGWGSDLLDETSFQFIVHILESEWGYRVRHYAPSSLEVIDGTNYVPISSR
ncbi:MAG: hypothetical protein PVH35_03035 [Syntrophobacterales bacterium]|jgi:hypothetical protein